MTVEGGCHCGAVRYTVAGAPLRHSLCHCVDCRRVAGAPFVGWMMIAKEQLTVTGRVATYASSEPVRRDFCPTCGTGLFYYNEEVFPGLVDVQSATLDDPDMVPGPSEQIQVAERIGWMKTAHALPEHARFPPE